MRLGKTGMFRNKMDLLRIIWGIHFKKGGMSLEVIGKSVIRKEALDKVTGRAKYTHDYYSIPMLSGKMVISPYGHAKIVKIDTTEASRVSGVRAILAGKQYPLTEEAIRDRPPIAVDKVRYHGETVAFIPELIWRAKEAQRNASL
jgi:CO/xanthine dehydrogenase Mo-binding subunit